MDKLELLLKLIDENPDDVVNLAKEYIDKYKPAVYDLLKLLFADTYKDFVNSDMYSLTALAAKRKYDAYVEAGFTEDQAFILILNSEAALSKSLNNIKINTSSKK